MPGPPPIPVEMKIAEGTFRPDLHGKIEEQVFAEGAPQMPDDLSKEGKAEWQAIVPGILELGVAHSIDSQELADLCEWRAVWKKQKKALLRANPVTNKNYNKILRACHVAWSNFFRLAERFGLSPSDRAKLRATPKKKAGVEARKRG